MKYLPNKIVPQAKIWEILGIFGTKFINGDCCVWSSFSRTPLVTLPHFMEFRSTNLFKTCPESAHFQRGLWHKGGEIVTSAFLPIVDNEWRDSVYYNSNLIALIKLLIFRSIQVGHHCRVLDRIFFSFLAKKNKAELRQLQFSLISFSLDTVSFCNLPATVSTARLHWPLPKSKIISVTNIPTSLIAC